jgi:hypothetical protein
MKHARNDYKRIQDPAGLIPEDEPVFLLRAQDKVAPETVEMWAQFADDAGAAPNITYAALKQAREMREWQKEHGCKVPDMP